MISLNKEQFLTLENIWQEIIAENGFSSLRGSMSVHNNNYLSAARAEIVLRRNRLKLFSNYDIFFDPAWDILLELFVADATETKLSVTAIGLESGVAQTTVIRWISVMEGYGLVQRVDDALDRRRNWIYLTNKSKAIMMNYFKNSTNVAAEVL